MFITKIRKKFEKKRSQKRLRKKSIQYYDDPELRYLANEGLEEWEKNIRKIEADETTVNR